MKIDERFSHHFQNIKQVFLYITDECNLNCLHCLYKPELTLSRSIKPEIAENLLHTFKKMGAFKLSILGGEATLYGADNKWKKLLRVIEFAKNIGYSYIRIDTNGQFDPELLHEDKFRFIDEISFSLEGYDSETNDGMRGAGTFKNTIARIREAKEIGFTVHITTCVTSINSFIAKTVYNFINKMILFAEREKVDTINFHGVFKMGLPMDTWVNESFIDALEWYEAYNQITSEIEQGKYGIHVRIPAHVIKRSTFEKNPQYYGYCPAKLGERVLIHPNGQIRICSSLLCTAYCVAKYNENEIIVEKVTNELYKHSLSVSTHVQIKHSCSLVILFPFVFH